MELCDLSKGGTRMEMRPDERFQRGGEFSSLSCRETLICRQKMEAMSVVLV